MNLSQPLSRLGRYLDEWNDGAQNELKHIMGYVEHTVTYNLTFITYGNDAREDVNIFMYSDLSFASPRSDGGRLIVLAGHNGSTYPGERKSKRKAMTATSSGDAETIEWSSAVKAGTRSADMLEFSRIRHPEIIGRTDNDSLQLAVQRGSSTKLRLLRRTAEVNFNFLKMTQIPLGRVDTSELRRHFHENTHRHKATVSPVAFVHVGCEPQQQFASCPQRRTSQTMRNM